MRAWHPCSMPAARAMPSRELRYRPEAVRDLQSIYLGVLTVSQSRVVAERYVARIRKRCRLITVLPHAGRPRDDLAPGIRTVAFERRAVIVYRVDIDTVEIINIFHGGRDYEVLFRTAPDDSN